MGLHLIRGGAELTGPDENINIKNKLVKSDLKIRTLNGNGFDDLNKLGSESEHKKHKQQQYHVILTVMISSDGLMRNFYFTSSSPLVCDT